MNISSNIKRKLNRLNYDPLEVSDFGKKQVQHPVQGITRGCKCAVNFKRVNTTMIKNLLTIFRF